MPETIRLVSDGEELVLSTQEPTAGRKNRERTPAGAKPAAVQYLGFQDVQGRREYALRARWGAEERQYTLSIELAAFAKRQALLQDGPHICYQKLVQELADAEQGTARDIVVTQSDLAAYKESHSVPARGRSSPPRSGVPLKV